MRTYCGDGDDGMLCGSWEVVTPWLGEMLGDSGDIISGDNSW